MRSGKKSKKLKFSWEVSFLISFGLAIFSIYLINIGFHNVDLAVHYFTLSEWRNYREISSFGNSYSIEEVYMIGTDQILIGSALLWASSFLCGLSMANLKRETKRFK